MGNPSNDVPMDKYDVETKTSVIEEKVMKDKENINFNTEVKELKPLTVWKEGDPCVVKWKEDGVWPPR